ncbi:MAG: putative Ig domain-containing protein, partial [Nitrospirota bacterium]
MYKGFLYLLLMMSFVLSCSSEKQKEVQAPPTSAKETTFTSKLEIQPSQATREATFYISSKGLDLAKAKLQWYVNGKPVEGAITAQFKPSEIKKGDSVQVKAVISDQEVASNQITIKNIPPAIIRAKIEPTVPKVNDTLKIDVIGNDRDGDKVAFKYEWLRNDKPSGGGLSLSDIFNRGDKVSVKIIPFDGEEYGQPITLTTNIYNSPPKPLASSIEKFENNVYYYQVKATDPDGDTLTYNLKQAPKGMVIDKTSGLITWSVAEKDSGRHLVTVEITDGHGGNVLYNFDV